MKTGIDWVAVKAELSAAEVYESDGCEERSVFLGTVLGLYPSGKFYTPWACSNVDACQHCKGEGSRLRKTLGKRRYKKLVAEQDRLRGLAIRRGLIGGEYLRGPLGGKHYRYLRSVLGGPSATCDHCGGCGSREAYLDSLFSEALESEAIDNGCYVFSGEGDPCDIFIGQQV